MEADLWVCPECEETYDANEAPGSKLRMAYCGPECRSSVALLWYRLADAPEPEPTGFWACVQLMGHSALAGRVTYRENGTVLVDVPAYTTPTGEQREAWARILYPGAVYAITPCTEEEATTAAGMIDAPRISAWLLSPEAPDPDAPPF